MRACRIEENSCRILCGVKKKRKRSEVKEQGEADTP